MASPIPTGRWWRFTEYEIRGGAITPTRAAELKDFDPWAAYWARRPGRRLRAAPYLSLVELARDLPDVTEARDGALDDGVRDRVLAWCQQFGLLGLLPHRALFAVVQTQGRNPGRFYLSRDVDQWASWSELDAVYENAGEPVPDWGESHVLVERQLGPPGPRSLKDEWARFFPRENLDDWGTLDLPPEPLTEGFWFRYGEPLTDFVRAAREFAAAFAGARASDPTNRAAAVRSLNRLSRSSAPVVEVEYRQDKRGRRKSRSHLRWRSPSLIGMFAVMASLDLLGPVRAAQCPCGRAFLSSDPRARYCSPEHGALYKKREQRAREARAVEERRARRLRSRRRRVRRS